MSGRRRAPSWFPRMLALPTLVSATAALYLCGLGGSGWSNAYYAAAVQAATVNPRAMLFGSLDAAGAITVDKPPAALWVMDVSARLFGLGPWSLLVPQAVEGVAAAALLYATVARWWGRPAGLAAGAILACTPVAAVMFRMDDPDALMILLLVAAAYCTVRACGDDEPEAAPAPVRWMAAAGLAVGLAFLAKMGQALLVVPALAAAVSCAGAIPVRRRITALAAAASAAALGAGWYFALVALWPEGTRPFIGGSTDDSLLQLAFGYNGLGRLAGGHGNPVAGAQSTGPWRLFGEYMGDQISWLLPAALLAAVVLAAAGVRSRHDGHARLSVILWGGWLLVPAVVFSAMQGIVHSYYTAMLAPAIAALIATGAALSWRHRRSAWTRLAAAAMTAVSGVWAFVLLGRTPYWLPWLRWVVLLGCAAAALVLAFAALLPLVAPGTWARPAGAAAAASCVAVLLAPAAYTTASAAQPHGGANPSAGPHSHFAALGAASAAARHPALTESLRSTRTEWAAAAVGAPTAARLELATGRPVMAVGGYSGRDPAPTLAQFQADVASGRIRYFLPREGLDLFSTLLPESSGSMTPTTVPGDGPRRPDSAASLLSAPLTAPAPATEAARITDWVRSRFAPVHRGGRTVYDLAHPAPHRGGR